MQPGQELIQEVRAGFIRQGSTLSEYCRDNVIDGGNVYRPLRGQWNSDKAKARRAQIIEAAKISGSETQDS